MGWYQQSKLHRAAASVLGMGATERPPSHWDEPIAAAWNFARGAIRRALAVRGFTPAQVEQWDDLEDFHRRVAICNLFREGGIGKGYDNVHLGEYCKALGELASVPVTIDGIVIDPSSAIGGCTYGEYDDSTARIAQMDGFE